MAIDDFIEYLGKEVVFISKVDYFGTNCQTFERVSGVIGGIVLLYPDLSESEFFVDDDTYSFSQVTFVHELENPVRKQTV